MIKKINEKLKNEKAISKTRKLKPLKLVYLFTKDRIDNADYTIKDNIRQTSSVFFILPERRRNRT